MPPLPTPVGSGVPLEPSAAASSAAALDSSQPAPATSARRGARITRWFVDVKSDRRSCTCWAGACREPFQQQDLRVRSAANTVSPKWYHPGCVEGGLGPFTDVEGSEGLPAEKQDELRPFCDLPGRVSRAQYVADVRQAKRSRLSSESQSAPVVEDLVDDADDPLPEDDVDGNGVPSEPTLKNMSWWDGVSYNSLERWVPTVGKVPADVHHGLALLRGAVCRDMRLAREGGDVDGERRAGKLLTFLDQPRRQRPQQDFVHCGFFPFALGLARGVGCSLARSRCSF